MIRQLPWILAGAGCIWFVIELLFGWTNQLVEPGGFSALLMVVFGWFALFVPLMFELALRRNSARQATLSSEEVNNG